MIRRLALLCASWWLVGAVAMAAQTDDVTLSARVDTAHPHVGEPVQVTVSVEAAALQGLVVRPLNIPTGWSAVAESQSQQTAWQHGQLHRRMEFTYVLVPHAAGTVQLGPFIVERHQQHWHTEPLTIHVEEPPKTAPPTLEHPPGGRVTL